MVQVHDPDRLAVAANQNSTERAYWLEQLSRPVKQSFPYDFVYEGEQGEQRQQEEVEICFSPDIVSRLMELSNGTDVKLNMVLTAAVVVLLYKYTGERDIITGAPIYRQRVDSEFINTVLPLRHRLLSRMTFKMLLRQVRQTIADAVKHQNFPVLLLPGPGLLDLPVQGDPCPLFDVAVLLGNLHNPRYIAHMKHNVTFGFYRDGVNEVMGGLLLYNPRLFHRESMETLVRRFTWLLEALIFNVDIELGGVDMLTEQERKKIEEEFNGRTANYPADKTLHRLFEKQAERTPDRIAAVGLPDGFLTYRELNEKSNRLARLLRANGITSDIPVGIMTEPSLEMMTGLLGILKAGGAYLPLDPGFPAERIAYMLNDSRTEMVLSVRDLKERIPAVAGAICMDDMDIYRGNGANLKHPDSPRDLAYITYTSGTTGRPKGVLTEHGNVVAYVFAFYCEFSISEQDTGLQLAPYTSDMFTEEVYPLLLKGGKTVIPPDGEAVNVPRLIEWMAKHGVTLVDTTPVLLREFNRLADRIMHGAGLPKLTFISGGETLKPGYVDKLATPGSGYRVYNTYGPTETTVCATYYCCKHGISWRTVPIGRPISNYHVDILNEAGLPQPVGIAGEISIAGPGVARGYLNEVEKTYRTYKTYRTDRTNRTYRSGDRGRWLPDGSIEFLGRGDGQVKIRGFRVELGEIENRLTTHEGVTQAVVTVREKEDGDTYLCAYVVCKEGFEFSSPVSEVLKDYLALTLPYYMIPLCVAPIPAVPVTSTGKIDTRALPEPEIASPARYEAPANSLEKDIRRVWCELFGKERIGVHDDFFDLGGHSLKGIQLLNALHREMGVRIPLVELFRTRTIRGLARYITDITAAKGSGETFPSLEPVEKKEYYPLSSAQKQLYFMQQLNPENTAYNVPGMLATDIDTGLGLVRRRVEDTFKKLIRRHESLRTSFHIIGGEPVQRIRDDAEFEIEYFEPGMKPPEETRRDFIRPFDLAHAPLMRVGLMKTEKGTDQMMVDVHHIITDAISQQILVTDFSSLYDGKELPALKLHYKDYCGWLAKCREEGEGGGAFIRQREYWLREFSGVVPRLELPADFSRPPRPVFEGAVLRFDLPLEKVSALKQLARENGATLFMVLLAVYCIMLAKIGGEEDIVIGTPAAGRRHPDLEPVMGIFVNTLALRFFPAENKTFTTLLKEVKTKTPDAFENQDYPFEELVERLAVRQEVNRGPLFDCLFSLHEFPETVISEDIRAVANDNGFRFEQPTSKFDITLTGVVKGDILFFLFRYSTALFKKEKIGRFADYFKKIVSTVVTGPGVKIGNISLTSQEEKEAMISQLSANLRV